MNSPKRSPLNKKIQTIKPSGIRRFFNMAASMSDVISLGVGEPDFDTPWHIREEAMKAIRQGKTFYSSNSGLLELRTEIAAFNKRKYGISYDPETEMIITVGVSEAIDLVMRTMLDPGDEVIVLDPSYVSYAPCVVLADGVPVIVPLEEADDFKLTPEKLEAAITEKTKLVMLCFPNNPTGAIMEKEDLAKIVEIIKKHDLFVLSDEVYSELTYTGKPHVSIASFPGMKERTIVLNGFSKAFAMTGWRLGYTLAPEIITSQMIKIHQYAIIAPSTIAQTAAISAIRDSDEDVKTMRIAYNQRRRFLFDKFQKMGLHCFEPKGAFYFFINVQPFGLSSEEFCERLLNEEKLAVVPGSAFGESGEGYIRISYAYSLKQLSEAVERLEAFINRIK